MYALEAEIRAIAQRFVSDLLSLIQRHSFADSAAALANAAPRSAVSHPLKTAVVKGRAKGAGTTQKNARRTRRSSEEVLALRDRIIEMVTEAPEQGLAVSEIAARLGISVQDAVRPLALAVQSGALVRQGEKRLARYFPAQK